MGKYDQINPHPDCEANNPPTIRIFTSSSKKIARMLDLFSNNQLISLLEIDQLHNFQVRVGYCYRKAVRFVGSSRIENSPYHALFVKYFNFEIIFDGRQSYFTNFETSDNIPYLIFLSDKNVKYTRDQLYLVNLRLVFPRTERGKILNNIMHTKNCI